MMTIVGCKLCRQSTIPFGQGCVDVTISNAKWCKECGQSKTDKQTLFFCSIECFNAYFSKQKLEWSIKD